jgi:hypothetical protein
MVMWCSCVRVTSMPRYFACDRKRSHLTHGSHLWRLASPRGRAAYWRWKFGVACLSVPLLGSLPSPCRFAVGVVVLVVGVAVLVVGVFLLWMLLGLFLLSDSC